MVPVGLVEVDLFTVTLDEIAEKCAVPEHWKKRGCANLWGAGVEVLG